ncbi:MAG: hypothetical protein MRERC_13c048 [Mycoplasmataceae bacterium RC_NB112A]|nr:MAG: hypothetical protein MRERC_13c048 [Mycoplasmataceae bacterium RC_NB112A]
MVRGKTNRDWFEDIITSNKKVYIFVNKVWDAWRDHPKIAEKIRDGLRFPTLAEFDWDRWENEKKGRVKEEQKKRKGVKIINIILSAYNQELTALTIKIREVTIKELRQKFKREGRDDTTTKTRTVRREENHGGVPIIHYDEVTETKNTPQFETELGKIDWNQAYRKYGTDDPENKPGPWSTLKDEEQRINNVRSMYEGGVTWDSKKPTGNFGDGSDTKVKEKCGLHPDCKNEGPDNYKNVWKRWKEDNADRTGIEIPYFCSDDHLYKWLKREMPDGEFTKDTPNPPSRLFRDSGKKYARCANCFWVSTEKDFMDDNLKNWVKSKKLGMFHSKDCYNKKKAGDAHPYQSEINDAIAEIRDELDKEPKTSVSELEAGNQHWVKELNEAKTKGAITAIKTRILMDIQKKRASKTGDGSDPLARYKGEAIGAIDSALLLDPEVKLEELEAGNRNFATQINGVDSKNINAKEQIDAIKSRVLVDIEKVRKAKQQEQNENETTRLEKLRTEVINLIHQELKRKPSLSESDIDYKNWESEIKNASAESKINEIKDKVLAEIKNKRASLKEELEVRELIEQVKKATLFAELSEIISKLGNYSSTKTYQDNQNEIDELENRLKSLDSSKYTEQTKKDLNNQLKNEGLSEKDLDEDTKKAKVRAEQTGDPADKKAATQKISQNGAKNNLKKLLSKAVSLLANPKASQIEKEQLAAEIQQFIGKDDFKKTAYQKEKDKVDSLLVQLREQSSQNQSTSPKSKWPKVLGIGSLVIIPLSLVGWISGISLLSD